MIIKNVKKFVEATWVGYCIVIIKMVDLFVMFVNYRGLI